LEPYPIGGTTKNLIFDNSENTYYEEKTDQGSAQKSWVVTFELKQQR
jgi:hypothetical protein